MKRKQPVSPTYFPLC